ncbi:MAG: phytanoyl-CoA dioxygenase [Actinomycetia bacterium]|nr:phytanoyl-CoA dioxygenase [Actinomycetes bacterium]MCP4957758.1 phytanoyl-CoA dioxygenase [Actinomycetes bacterium]
MFDISQVSASDIDAYHRDGVVLVKGLFGDWVDIISAGIERNMADPGPSAAENTVGSETGRFFDDYCNWNRIPEFERVVRHSAAAEVAGLLMQSPTVQIFHDHILVKEPGTSTPTPWHQDGPYYFVEGEQTLSLWSPMDPVSEATLRFVAGSHRWEKPVVPTRWVSGDESFPGEDVYQPVPDPDAEPGRYHILEWDMEPGDAVAFDYRTLHGARENQSTERRRAFALRFVGEDARFTQRPGPTSPPFHGHGMTEGQRLREDWFPTIYSSR